jgi:hypothetical protein
VRTVYGIRLRGSMECRYVGQTMHDGQIRLASLLSEAKKLVRWQDNPRAFSLWLTDFGDEIEAFTFIECSDEEARDEERRAVQTCIALGHRLFNRQLVPAPLRAEPWHYCSYRKRAA